MSPALPCAPRLPRRAPAVLVPRPPPHRPRALRLLPPSLIALVALHAGEVLELAVLASVRQGDDAGFERNFAQLRPFYTDARAALPPSPQEPALAALRLLALLAHNRIAEFHTAVELAPEVVLSSPEAAQVLQLEGWLMEGAYNKVLAARASPASPYFAPLLDRLAGTVRDEVAGCAEAAYASLPEGEAARMLTLAPGAELGAYAAARGWAVAAGRVVFKPEGGGAAAPAVPALEIIDHCLTYAKELERII